MNNEYLKNAGINVDEVMNFWGDIEAYKDNLYYIICVQDNGGGFPNPDIIYKEPVVSSDNSRGKRMGAGTVYIDMFVKRMHGFIVASNEVYNDGYLGAKTKIFIPIVSKNEEAK